MLAMLDARIDASRTQGLASTERSIATGVDRITPSSHGLVLAEDIAVGAFDTVTICIRLAASRNPQPPIADRAPVILTLTWSRVALLGLDLNRSAVIIGRARNDYEVAPWRFFFASHQLADRPDRVDDGRTRRVGHETLNGL